MTLQFSTNLSPATGADAIYAWKEFLKTCGWTITASGDGQTTFNTSGTDLITSSAVLLFTRVSTPLCGAWFTIQSPDGQRQFNVQKISDGSTTHRAYRIKFSRAAKFTGGTPSAYQVPSATDEVVLLAGGTDASPSNIIPLFSTSGTYKLSMAADNAAPYGFWFLTYTNSTGALHGSMVFDPLVSGTYPAEDIEPYVLYFSPWGQTAPLLWSANSGGIALWASFSQGYGRVAAWYKAGMAGAAFVPVGAAGLLVGPGGAVVAPGNLGPNAHNGNDDLTPLFYVRDAAQTTPTGWKGMSSLLRWKSSTRSNATTYSIGGGTRNYVQFGDVVLNWDGSVVAL